MPGHKRHTNNARTHDARTLRTIAARMQTRGDDFALADRVIALASELDACGRVLALVEARDDDDTVTVPRAFADAFPCAGALLPACNLDGPRVGGLPTCDRCGGLAPGRAACATDSQSFTTDSQSVRARISGPRASARAPGNPIGG